MLGLAAALTPFPNEGLQGYLARLASANAISIQEIMRYYRTTMSSDPMHQGPYPACWQEIRHQIISPPAIPMTLWNSRGRRFCPACLDRDGFWHVCWELTLVTECHEHKVGLVHECPSCNMALSWHGTDLHSCGNCGKSLLHANITNGEPKALWLSTEFGKRLSDDNVHSIDGIGALNVSELHDLAVRLGARISESTQKKPLKIKCSSSLLAARRVSNAAAGLLNDWPRGFNRHLRHLISKEDRTDWKMASRFGRLYEDIYKHLPESCFNFVREEFESTLSIEWHGPVGHRNRRLSRRLVESPLWVPVKTAAIRTNVDMSLIRRMAETGEIHAVQQRSLSGRTSTLVSIDDIRKLSSNIPFAFSLQEASSRLALPESRIRQMLEVGILHYLGGRPSGGERWWISSRSIERFAGIGSKLDLRENSHAVFETLSDSLRYRLKSASQATEVICRIVDGSLKPVARHASPEAVGSWFFRISDLIGTCKTPSQEGLLTINGCASALRIKEQVAYELVRLSLIEGLKDGDGETRGIRIGHDAISEFQREFVLGRDIAASLGRSPRWLASNLLSAGYAPVAGPGVVNANCRQYVWHRSVELDCYIASISQRTA